MHNVSQPKTEARIVKVFKLCSRLKNNLFLFRLLSKVTQTRFDSWGVGVKRKKHKILIGGHLLSFIRCKIQQWPLWTKVFSLNFFSNITANTDKVLETGPLSLMSLHVKRKMVRTRETSLTMCTLKWFHTSVLSMVSRQFIWSGESPFTSFPRTSVWFFTCNKNGNGSYFKS